MDINEMTIEQFKELPNIEKCKVKEFDSIVLLPTKIKHDSGYNYYSVVICNGHKAIGRTELYDTFSIFPGKNERVGIDCLRKSGLMRVFFSPYYSLYESLHMIREKCAEQHLKLLDKDKKDTI